MKKFQALLFLFTLSLTSCVGTSQLKKTRIELLEKEKFRYQLPPDNNVVLRPVFPKVKKSTLKNGLQVLVVEDNRLPIAQVSLALKHGSANDPIGKSGLNYLTALMLKEGAGKLNSLELAEAFANLGTEVSVGVNQDMMEISAGVLSSKVGEIMSLIASMAKEPRFIEADFDRIKSQHQNLLSSYQGIASYVAQNKFLQAAYGDKHPYANPSSGTLKSLSSISLADIKKAHQDNFGANSAALIVVGDVKLGEVESLAKKYFGSFKKNSAKNISIPEPTTNPKMRTILVERSDAPQTYIMVGRPLANRYDPDLASFQVLQNILSGSPASRLDANLREAKGWTYGVSSSASALRGKGAAVVGSSIQTPFGADALNEILMEFEKLSTTPVSDDELITAKNHLLQSFAARYSTLAKVAGSLADNFVYSLPLNSDEKLYDDLANVNKESIMKVSTRAFKKDGLIAVAVGNLEVLEPSMAKVSVGKVSVEHEAKPND